jgi:branched-chain amino acid transport system permease protein
MLPLSFYAEIIAAGVLTGLVYGLMALGLSVIFGVIRVVNFAHGEMAVIAMYTAFFAARLLGLDPLLALAPIAAGLFVIGWALQRTLISPFITRPEHEQFILLVGVAMIVLNLTLIAFGPDSRNPQLAYAYDSFELPWIGMLVDKVRLYAAGAALIVAALLFAFFRYTPTGTAIRACADNLVGAAVVGLDVKRLYALTFGVGSACVGAAGSLMVLLTEATPALGPAYTLLAFTVVIIGGLGSMMGALVGGVLIGVSEALAGYFIAPSLKTMFSFALLIVVLLLRPQGLFGKRA